MTDTNDGGRTEGRAAPGRPGISPRWTSSDKSGVGTALSALSRVWFTISHGILNEVYYPRVDQACVRDLGFMVSDGVEGGFFSEEKRGTGNTIRRAEDGVPMFDLTNVCSRGRYRIEKRILSDSQRDVVLQRVRLIETPPPADGGSGTPRTESPPLRLFALLAPHLVNGGAHNTAWCGDYKGVPMMFAEGDGTSLALAASVPWLARSAGYVGVSDGFQQVSRSGLLIECYDHADDGNVALCGELDLSAAGADGIVIALSFGRTWSEAALRARASVNAPFARLEEEYATQWRKWQGGLLPLDRTDPRYGHNPYRISTAVLRAHDSPSFPGGIIASLSIPWGAAKGDDDLGGYHLVWPRDLAETGGGLLACGARAGARRVLDYLRAIQDADGGWPQNAWLDGLPYWRGMQLDECAFPILLLELQLRTNAITRAELATYWPMARAAAGYVLRHGPITGQDRWEEDSGFSTFTLAVEIASLLAAATLADLLDHPDDAALFRDTADAWNARVEEWTYARGTPLATALGIDGYYVRIAPPEGIEGEVVIKNRAGLASRQAAAEVVSPDALALVRFGLRAADDPRILGTVQAIDDTLRIELPAGPCWHRYNGDGYGEHEDGAPFDGVGIGRAWPLLTGERAHYELARGNIAEAARLLSTMEALTSRGGLLPEQVWDADDIPDLELFRGQPTGSAMPLVWAHAEHVKLCRSIADGRVFDLPPQPVQRYQTDRVPPRCVVWRPELPTSSMAPKQTLRIDLPGPATIHWTTDGWKTTIETPTNDTGLGLHVATLTPPEGAASVTFTYQWLSGDWAGKDSAVTIARPDQESHA